MQNRARGAKTAEQARRQDGVHRVHVSNMVCQMTRASLPRAPNGCLRQPFECRSHFARSPPDVAACCACLLAMPRKASMVHFRAALRSRLDRVALYVMPPFYQGNSHFMARKPIANRTHNAHTNSCAWDVSSPYSGQREQIRHRAHCCSVATFRGNRPFFHCDVHVHFSISL
jgi:hypothetical protein